MDYSDYPDEWKTEKKIAEYRSLEVAISKLDFLRRLKNISLSNQEKPDFVFINNKGNRIGIEHFCIDISMGSRNDSSIKISRSRTRRIYEKYHGDIANHIGGAITDTEEMLNSLARDWQKFNYSTFLKNFKRVFYDHYSKIDEYRTEGDLFSIGLLIEFLVPNNTYKVSLKGEPLHIQELSSFPVTEEMWQVLSESLNGLAFVILDTNQCARRKDTIVLIDRKTTPKILFKEFAPPLKGESGKVIIHTTSHK